MSASPTSLNKPSRCNGCSAIRHFSIYAIDNATTKVVGEELRATLARVKDGLLVNRNIEQAETFEL